MKNKKINTTQQQLIINILNNYIELNNNDDVVYELLSEDEIVEHETMIEDICDLIRYLEG